LTSLSKILASYADTAQALIFFTQQKNQTAKRELSGDKKNKTQFYPFLTAQELNLDTLQ
jgi:hypothetical protein